jgi:hypothetical protein
MAPILVDPPQLVKHLRLLDVRNSEGRLLPLESRVGWLHGEGLLSHHVTQVILVSLFLNYISLLGVLAQTLGKVCALHNWMVL